MERVNLTKQFSERLRAALVAAGYGSTRSATGVNLQKFASLTGHSTQICRKYLHGHVIPEAAKLSSLAQKLQVSPGWLLFGDCHSQQPLEENKVTISKPLLHYIFSHANALYNSSPSSANVPDFLIELTHDVSQINTNYEQSKKIIDLALCSAQRLNPGANNDENRSS